ncbi:putative immunity protein [Nocardioides sp. GXZ039]|uniref:putative immunity protein n=1 Tax=Nocardioides sp. GXZ039 TaxID=3136018 RepID=UPI0030F4089E
MASPQTLTEPDRRLLAGWAALCAEHVLAFFEAPAEADAQIRDALDRAKAFARGESTTDAEIAKRMIAVKAASAAITPAGAAAARAVGQAAAVAHMGAHALGAAAYAVKARSLAAGGPAADEELHWQLTHLGNDERAALARLPALGSDRNGPLGPGLLSRGILGDTIRTIQRQIVVP